MRLRLRIIRPPHRKRKVTLWDSQAKRSRLFTFVAGVVSLFVCGVVLAHYNWHNLSHPAKLVTGHICKTLVFVAETIVFAYLGLSASDPTVWTANNWPFVAVGLVTILIGDC